MTSNKDIIIFDEKDSENNCLSFRGHCEKIISIIYLSNCNTIVSVGIDNRLRTWNINFNLKFENMKNF